MADIARVGFAADTAGLEKLEGGLNKITPAANNADKAIDKVEKTIVKANKAGFDWGDNLNTSGIAINKVTAAANGEAVAVTKVTAAMNGNTAATVANTAANQNNANSAIAVNAAAAGVAANTSRIGTAMSVLGAVGRGVFYELAAGIGALLSPANLVFFAITTLANVVAGYFNTFFEGSSKADESLKRQNELISQVASKWGEAVPQISAYNDQLERQKEISDLIAAGSAINEENINKIRDAFAAVAPEAERLISELSFENFDNQKVIDLSDSFQTLKDKVADGTATQEDFNNVLTAAQDASASGVAGLSDFISMLSTLIGNVGPAIKAVNALNQAIANAASNMNNPAMWRSAGMTGQSADGPIQGSGATLPEIGPVPGSRGTPELSGFPWEKLTGGGGGRKSSGGGGSAKEAKTELEELAEGLRKLSEPFNQAKSAFTALDTALDNGIITNEQYQKSLGEIEAAFLKTGGTSEQWANVMVSNNKKVDDSTKFLKDTTKGFVSDFIDGLRNGEGAFESFGNALQNVASKLIDHGLNALIDKLFEVGDAASGLGGSGSGGGIAGLISKGISWLFGGKSAKGNAFDGGRINQFANGGTFTNSIVRKPTFFSYANGSAFGEMGEAGPEAIMPLKRGPDGSLGVQLHGAKGGGSKGGNQITYAPVNEQTFVLEGAVSEEKLVARIKATAEATLEESKKSMIGWLNQYQRDGVLL